MIDKPHPLTNIAKIQRGDLSPLREQSQAIVKPAPPVAAPSSSPPEPLSDERLKTEIQKLSKLNLKQNRIAAWWNKGQVEQVSKLLNAQLGTASIFQSFRDINRRIREDERELREKDTLEEAQLKVKHLILDNQATVIALASKLGIDPASYAKYTLDTYISQLKIQEERLGYEETFNLAITRAATIFNYQQELIRQIAELQEKFENIALNYRTNSAVRIARQEIRALIKAKQGELRASQAETFLPDNGAKTRRPKENEAEPEG